jgi:hypothetical protein
MSGGRARVNAVLIAAFGAVQRRLDVPAAVSPPNYKAMPRSRKPGDNNILVA